MKSPREGTPIGCLPGVFFCVAFAHAAITEAGGEQEVSIPAGSSLALSLACATLSSAEDPQKQKLDRDYQSAVADYDAGRYAAAADQLEALLPYAPNSFEVHELLGLCMLRCPQNDEGRRSTQVSRPVESELCRARTNLGTSLLHAGKAALAGEQFRKALQLEPQSFDANHNLGRVLRSVGKDR